MVCANPHDPTQVARYCKIIERSAKTQQQLIEDLLDTARIITGQLKLNHAPTDLLLVLEEALDAVRPAARAKQIDLVARLGGEPQQIIGDAARLQQVVLNLLQNAIKFTPDGGRVEIQLERDAGQIRIIVNDSGIGIEPEFLPAVFDRFSQQDVSRTRRYSGLGLGLSLVKQLVELHGGLIEAASAGAGRGATFTVTLPLRAPQIEAPPLSGRAIAEVQTGPGAIPLEDLPRLDGVRVLLVDDEEDARLMIAATLGEWGAAVTAVASGQQARAIMADASFDALVCDIAMPDEDGYEVIGRIRELENERGAPTSRRLPAIALTALARPEDRMQALEAGFQMHVAKPIELAELVVVIKSLVARSENQRQVK
jgi:CheY-like chemotaxis protein